MLVDYLVESRGWPGGVARTVATTHLIDRVAKLHGLELLETPVGFKYIGEYIKEGRIILGGEESAGLVDSRSRAGKGRHPGLSADRGNGRESRKIVEKSAERPFFASGRSV